MRGDLMHCWSCGKLGMEEVELRGEKWLKCKYCGATAGIPKRRKSKGKKVNQKRSKATQFLMPSEYFKKGGKHKRLHGSK